MGNILLLYTNVRGGGQNSSILDYVDGDVAGALAAVFLLFVLYITIRVIISLRQDRHSELSRRKRISALAKHHLLLRKKRLN
ncbi:MAG: hypothetical protein V4604_10015 [Bacteroidota bacterium]